MYTWSADSAFAGPFSTGELHRIAPVEVSVCTDAARSTGKSHSTSDLIVVVELLGLRADSSPTRSVYGLRMRIPVNTIANSS